MVHLYVRHIPNTCLKAPWNTQTLRGFSALLTSIHIEHPVQWACAQWSSRQLPYSLCLPCLGLCHPLHGRQFWMDQVKRPLAALYRSRGEKQADRLLLNQSDFILGFYCLSI